MKRGSCCFLLSIWAIAGCVTLPGTSETKSVSAEVSAPTSSNSRASIHVKAEEVTESNRKEIAKQLNLEIERDEKGEVELNAKAAGVESKK